MGSVNDMLRCSAVTIFDIVSHNSFQRRVAPCERGPILAVAGCVRQPGANYRRRQVWGPSRQDKKSRMRVFSQSSAALSLVGVL